MATTFTQPKLQLVLSLTLVFGLIAGIIAGLDSGRHNGHHAPRWENRGRQPHHPGHPTNSSCIADGNSCHANSSCCSKVCNITPPISDSPSDSSSSSEESKGKGKGVCVKNCTALNSSCVLKEDCCPLSDPDQTVACINQMCQPCVNVGDPCSSNSDCCSGTNIACYVDVGLFSQPKCKPCDQGAQSPCTDQGTPVDVQCCGGGPCEKNVTQTNTYTCSP